jgi:ADP-heptose:LPS heptosyltransferase
MTRMRRVVVLRGGALGDFIATLPVLTALRPHFSELRLYCPARFGVLAEVPGLCDAVDDILGAGALWLHGGEVPDWSDIDLAVTFVRGTENALRRAGVGRVLPGDPFGPARPVHRQLLAALAPLGLQDAPVQIKVPWKPTLKPPGVVLAPGSGGARKRWSLTHWESLSSLLVGRGIAVTWLAGPIECEEAPTWPVHGAALRVETDLSRTAAIAAAADAWVGVDAGTSHLANLVGCATHVLFGPTDPETWAPPGARIHRLEDSPAAIAERVLQDA